MAYLKVEAQNLGDTIFDVDQLSVVRGGSLAVREAIGKIEEELGKHKQFTVERISVGASIGLFEVTGDDLGGLEKAASKILNEHPLYRWFPFAVSVIEGDGSKETLHRLDACNRFKQLRQATIVVPAVNACPNIDVARVVPPEGSDPKTAPGFDDFRPADATIDVDRDQVKQIRVSTSIQQRHDFGRKEKHNARGDGEDPRLAFYHRESGFDSVWLDNQRFSNELAHIASNDTRRLGRKDATDPQQRFDDSLLDKMAVLYIDGNKFGKIRKALGDGAEAEATFDRKMAECRKQFLTALLQKCRDDETGARQAFHYFDDSGKTNRLRLETLLWGGDEFTLIVPAWTGIEVLRLFFDIASKWTIDLGDGRSAQLTFSAGLVFCSYKSPIERIRKVAKDLAESAKAAAPGGELADQRNAWDYLVLESLDYPVEDLPEFWSRRLDAPWDGLRTKPLGIDAFSKLNQLAALRVQLPRRPIERFVRMMGRGQSKLLEDRWKSLDEAVGECLTDATTKLQDHFSLAYACGGDFDQKQRERLAWLHLAELWDYLPPAAEAK